MKTPKIYSLVLFVFTLMTVNVYAQENQDRRSSREKWDEVTMQGTVTAIVADTREITLMGTDGGLVTITAGEAVERFDEIAVNDVLKFEYYTYMKAEFREPTAEEIAEPLVVMAEGGKAPEGMDPAAVVGAVVKAIVSIEVLNRPNMTATVKGPRGNYVTIQMEDETLITELKIGEVLILTYAEAIAVSLEKVGTVE
ncbi:MAG: hypothetical protein GQ552_07925 [Flavobacteriaceae bacterium]|nr:hypothetical protein [Flavobacteriaceae bacterium]